MILHPKSIAFSGIMDNKIASFYCEGSFNSDLTFLGFSIERYRTQ